MLEHVMLYIYMSHEAQSCACLQARELAQRWKVEYAVVIDYFLQVFADEVRLVVRKLLFRSQATHGA